MPWIDSHCHCSDGIWQENIADFFKTLAMQGCEAVIQGGIDPEEWQIQRTLPEQELVVVRVFGLHPWTVLQRSPSQLQSDLLQLEQLMPEAEGIGEIGLDFFRGPEPEARQKQRDWFEQQLQLADRYEKPAVLHIVRAYPEAWQLVKKILPKARGMIHSFWASLDNARPFLDAGWILSPHPRLLHLDPHGILKHFPREQIVFESDAPFAKPDGGYTTPDVTFTIIKHVAERWLMDTDELTCRQRSILSALFPTLSAKLPELRIQGA